MNQPRERWSSRTGFILAAAGSAVGLGNIWKFPHMAGQHGGAAFTLVYLVCIVVVGMPILLAEFSMGRSTQRNPVGAFAKLAGNNNWKWVGLLGVASAFVILSFYSVIGGWAMKYSWLALSGQFAANAATPDGPQLAYDAFISKPVEPILWHLAFMGMCVLIIVRGIKSGIEKTSKTLMPVLLVILLILVVRGLTLDGAGEGLRFLFEPKWGDLDVQGVALALGHSFFTISLGMGTMITYGSYLDNKSDLLRAGIWVVVLDTGIALLAGIAIFTAVFALGQDPAGGPGLIFVVLPSLFPLMPGGAFFAFLFFSLLLVAALTSAISILEVVVTYFIDEKGWSRARATYTFGGIIAVVGIFISLSFGNFNIIAPFTDLSFFDFMDGLSSKYMLPVGGLFTALFVLVKWGMPNFIEHMNVGSDGFPIPAKAMTAAFIVSALVVVYIIFESVIDLFG